MRLAEPTHAEQTFFAVMQRNDEPWDVWDLNLPEKILDPDETVIDVKVVDVDYKPAPMPGKLRVRLRDGSAITLTTATKGHAERFVATMRSLLDGAHRPRR